MRAAAIKDVPPHSSSNPSALRSISRGDRVAVGEVRVKTGAAVRAVDTDEVELDGVIRAAVGDDGTE